MSGDRVAKAIGYVVAAVLSLCACALVAALTIVAVRGLLG